VGRAPQLEAEVRRETARRRCWGNAALQGVTVLAGGEFQRATDPWVDFGPSNRVYAVSLGFDDTGPDDGLFVGTSTDGGATWRAPVPVIVDRQFEFFNDEDALAADFWSTSPHRGSPACARAT
jgi:hypothetical protein